MRRSPETTADVVVDLLESEGYEAVEVRTVARRARISLATMYELFATRDELILLAVERWMQENRSARPSQKNGHVRRLAVARERRCARQLHGGQVCRRTVMPWAR
jgi:AcrR family transcriptional regulator